MLCESEHGSRTNAGRSSGKDRDKTCGQRPSRKGVCRTNLFKSYHPGCF